MKGILYQLKSIRRDKFCIMSFLLPVIVAAALHFFGSIDFSSLGELQFCVVADDIAPETEAWLARYGSVTVCRTKEEMISAVREPSTNLIGVEKEGTGIGTVIAGDELTVWRKAAATLPALYDGREQASRISVQILKRPDILAGYQNLFIAMTLIIAMFMGCTFNAVNIISEKEEGVAWINEILPMTSAQYLFQKILIGFLFGCLSAILAAAICFRLPPARAAVMLALTLLSAFVSSLIGLFIGRLAENLMTGIVYIKILMLVFMGVPLLHYLAGTESKVISFLCFLIPSNAAFEGIMELAGGGMTAAGRDIAILLMHCAVWFLLWLFWSGRHTATDGT